jgi:glucan-binding YG repeat protein
MKRVSLKKYLLTVGIAMVFTVAGAISTFAKTRLDTPENLYWSNTTSSKDDQEKEGSIARWDAVENAHKYKVYVYCDESHVATKYPTKNYIKLRGVMNKEGDYTFRVQAMPKDNSKEFSSSSWSEDSDTYYVSASAAENADIEDDKTAFIVGKNEWKQDAATGKWYYLRSDGTNPKNQWFQDPDTQYWYFMGEDGYMVTGWFESSGQRYYLAAEGTPSGAMVTGDYTIDGITYHFDENGALVQ